MTKFRLLIQLVISVLVTIPFTATRKVVNANGYPVFGCDTEHGTDYQNLHLKAICIRSKSDSKGPYDVSVVDSNLSDQSSGYTCAQTYHDLGKCCRLAVKSPVRIVNFCHPNKQPFAHAKISLRYKYFDTINGMSTTLADDFSPLYLRFRRRAPCETLLIELRMYPYDKQSDHSAAYLQAQCINTQKK